MLKNHEAAKLSSELHVNPSNFVNEETRHPERSWDLLKPHRDLAGFELTLRNQNIVSVMCNEGWLQLP